MIGRNEVFIYKSGVYGYPSTEHAFSPSAAYPEYRYDCISSKENRIYDSIRECFRLCGYDSENFGTEKWNPLGVFIKPGDTVLLKPNLVSHVNMIVSNGTDCLITHPSIIRALSDYILIALDGDGKLIVGDAPVQECDFDTLVNEQGLDKIISFYDDAGLSTDIELCDFRNFSSKVIGLYRVGKESAHNKGITIDLGSESEFYDISADRCNKLRITNYPHEVMQAHHNAEKHEYIIAKKVLEADVIVNVPKPKTHRLAGVTIAMKNLIGICASKECLPHHSLGSIDENGDEYAERSWLKSSYSRIVDARNKFVGMNRVFFAVAAKMIEIFLRILISTFTPYGKIRFGAWHGNDTIWRTIIDINKIVFFADKNGKLQDTLQRKVLSIGDMVIAGHDAGPLSPSPKETGVIAVGEDVICFDEAVCAFMGFDYRKIPAIRNARQIKGQYDFSCGLETIVKSNDDMLNNKTASELERDISEQFIPYPAWKDYLV